MTLGRMVFTWTPPQADPHSCCPVSRDLAAVPCRSAWGTHRKPPLPVRLLPSWIRAAASLAAFRDPLGTNCSHIPATRAFQEIEGVPSPSSVFTVTSAWT